MYQWILRQQQEGMRVTTIDIVSHLQVLFYSLCIVGFFLGFCAEPLLIQWKNYLGPCLNKQFSVCLIVP
jgi:hypothetical protein